MSLLSPETTALLVIDVQEGFRHAVPQFEEVAQRSEILARAAAILGLETLATEQYPKGLKPTVQALRAQLAHPPLPKTQFSAARAADFSLAAPQVLICGIEAHVCVAQTVHDLLAQGKQVHVAADATASRSPEDRERALHRMEQQGATITTTEAALFELLGEAGTPEFKEIQRLVL